MDRTGNNEVRENAFQIWNEAVTSPEFPPIPIPHPQPREDCQDIKEGQVGECE